MAGGTCAPPTPAPSGGIQNQPQLDMCPPARHGPLCHLVSAASSLLNGAPEGISEQWTELLSLWPPDIPLSHPRCCLARGRRHGGREDQCISSLRPGAGSTPPHNGLPPIPEPTQERPLWLREGGASAAQEKRSRAPPSGSPGNTSLCVSRGPGPTLQAATKPLHHRNHKTTPRDPTNGCSLDGEEDQDSLHSQLPSACDLGSSQPGHFSAWFCLLCQGCHLPCPRSRFLTAVKAPASQPL